MKLFDQLKNLNIFLLLNHAIPDLKAEKYFRA